MGTPLLYPDDSSIIAIAADVPLAAGNDLPLLDLNRPEAVAEFILQYVGCSSNYTATA